MNNTIKQIAVNAGMRFDGFGEPILGALDSGSEFLEEFAKLIIAECNKAILTDYHTHYATHYQNYKHTPADCEDALVKHFGINYE